MKDSPIMEAEYQLARHLRKVLHLDCEIKMNEWISVKDKTPEVDETRSSNSEDVLILDCDGTMYVGHMNFYPVAGYRKESEVTWSENATGCGCCAEGLHPTHWMPLPKPPGEEK